MDGTSSANVASAAKGTSKRSREDTEEEPAVTSELFNDVVRQKGRATPRKPSKRRRASNQDLAWASQNVRRTSRRSKTKAQEYLKLVAPLLQARQTRVAQRIQADQVAESQMVWRGSTGRSHGRSPSSQHERSTALGSSEPFLVDNVAFAKDACNTSIARSEIVQTSEKVLGNTGCNNEVSVTSIPIIDRTSSVSLYSDDPPIIAQKSVRMPDPQEVEVGLSDSTGKRATKSTTTRDETILCPGQTAHSCNAHVPCWNKFFSPRRQATLAEEVVSKLDNLRQNQRQDRDRQDETSAQSRRQIEEQGISGQAKAEECLRIITSLQDQSRQDQERTNVQLTTLDELQRQSVDQHDQLRQTVTTNNKQTLLRADQLEQSQRHLKDLVMGGFEHVASRQDQAVVKDQELRQGLGKFAAHLEHNHKEAVHTQESLFRETQHGLQTLDDRLKERHEQQSAAVEEHNAEVKCRLEAMFQHQTDSRVAHKDDREMTVTMHQEVMAKLSEIANNARSDSGRPQQRAVSNVNGALGNAPVEVSAPQPQQTSSSPSHVAGLAARVRDLEERATAPQSVSAAAKDPDMTALLQRAQQLEAAAALHRTQQANEYLSRIANCVESLAARDPTATTVSAQINALNANMLHVSSKVAAHDVNLTTLTERVGAIRLEPGSNLETTSHHFEYLQRITQQWESQFRRKMNELGTDMKDVRTTLTEMKAGTEAATQEQSVQIDNIVALIRGVKSALDDHATHQQRLFAEVRALSVEDRGQSGDVPPTNNAEPPLSVTLPPQEDDPVNVGPNLQEDEPVAQTDIDTTMAEVSDTNDTYTYFSAVLNMPITASQYLDCIKLLEHRANSLQMQNHALQAALEAQKTHSSQFKRIATGLAADFEAIERTRQSISNIKNSAIDSDALCQGSNNMIDLVAQLKEQHHKRAVIEEDVGEVMM